MLTARLVHFCYGNVEIHRFYHILPFEKKWEKINRLKQKPRVPIWFEIATKTKFQF